jgi:hypothetical protein
MAVFGMAIADANILLYRRHEPNGGAIRSVKIKLTILKI